MDACRTKTTRQHSRLRPGPPHHQGSRGRTRAPTPPAGHAAPPLDRMSNQMLGRHFDAELARRLRRSEGDVRRQRLTLGIPALRPGTGRPWKRHEEKLLGTLPDAEVARRLKRTLGSPRRGVRGQSPDEGNTIPTAKFLHKVSLLIRAEFGEIKTGEDYPRRFCLRNAFRQV